MTAEYFPELKFLITQTVQIGFNGAINMQNIY